MTAPRLRRNKRSRNVGCSFTKITGVAALSLLCIYLLSVFSLISHTRDVPLQPKGSVSSPHTTSEVTPSKHPPPKKESESKRARDGKPSDFSSAKTDESSIACQQLLQHFRNTHQSECTSIEQQYLEPPHVDSSSGLCSFEQNDTTGRGQSFPFDRQRAEAYLSQHGSDKFHRVITAYIEPPLQDTIPGTGSRGDLEKKDKNTDQGTPPEFKIPLPLRPHTPADLTKYEYPRVQTCHDMPAKFPVDRGLEYDPETGQPIVWNVGNNPMPENFPQQEAPYCPVEADPFLPWIHDVFPSVDGTKIEFVAQNKRRCRTGKNYTPEVNRLVPQVALMQSISVERIDESTAQQLAPELWHGSSSSIHGDGDEEATTPRYRLAPIEESSPDGRYTRFICRFHVVDFSDDDSSSEPESRIVGETLSGYDFNYELVSYRKGNAGTTLITAKGKDTRLFWASNIRFHCPVPSHLQDWVASGATVLSNGSPTLFVDLVPIRTSTRYKEIHMGTELIGPKDTWQLPAFDAKTRWGDKNVLPRVEASGRWTNIPICLPPAFKDEMCDNKPVLAPKIAKRPSKPHTLSACLWASAEFKTRGISKGSSTDTADRLREWLEFHLMVGFDHVYVYDNSGAHTNETSLKPILDQYPASKVTWIDWPSIVCNNNIPAHDSTGERSSQYAAENSCRTRYGPLTEFIAAFDTDEYLVPMGEHKSLKEVLEKLSHKTNILSMRSSRGRLRVDKSEKVTEDAIEKRPDVTFLEAYNCDSAGLPKPSWADRARKQIYRTDYVLYHYVHYSTVTRGYLQSYKDLMKDGISSWKRKYGEKVPSERVSDELNEVVMVHTKSLQRDMTSKFETRCRHDYGKKWHGCWAAYPYPANATADDTYGPDGMEYNCYINERVENYWIPRLREAMRKRKEEWENRLAAR